VNGVPFSGPENATFTLHATSSSLGNCGVACASGDTFTQQGFSGTFSFIDAGSAPGTNLLSGTFAVNATPASSGGTIGGDVGATDANFRASSDSSNLSQLVMSSQYLNFLNQTQETASWSISSLIPNFAVGTVVAGQSMIGAGPFNGSGTGTFSSNPGPTGTPEPESVFLIGGGLVGLAVVIRKRRPAAV
jgi:PEP-CTERM motif